MSKIGLGNNINQPTKQCFSCKYWKAATKLSLLEITEPGYCSAGFCKKMPYAGKGVCRKRKIRRFSRKKAVLPAHTPVIRRMRGAAYLAPRI